MIELEHDPGIAPGDTVHIGAGKTLWTVETIWPDGQHVSLKPVDGYSDTTVLRDRLVLVEKASAR